MTPLPSSPRINVDRFNAILSETTPAAAYLGIKAERIGVGEAVLRIAFASAALRSGGTYSGPALMALVDACMYAAVLGVRGDDPRPVTTNLAITFLRRASARDLIAQCRLLSCDSDFAVGSIVVHPFGIEEETVCTSTCTYALPPRTSNDG
ncbi:PaaI family thioesterase [Bradyrhizobium sp.]|uniref:PaaI family thioesterase n=1 Tax=Bradyrhizobium sp. TaxID=376 RepID=UPI002CB75DB8|nr:PaaI family thioesterase [Bradyrhizobium sp.]HMM91461.1 PaaI family thioesterase [Bradyrhizobium sp.]